MRRIVGILTAGLAALPFIEPGLGEDAPCPQLLAAADAYAAQESEASPAEASEDAGPPDTE